MCYDDDARNWRNLNDLTKINLDVRKTKTINISENWFATTVAVSFVANGERLITYANGLNTDGGMCVSYAVC